MANEYIITQEDLNKGNSYLQTLTTEHPVCRIADGVTTIGNNAFSGCINLISIIIPKTVKSIGYRVFKGCTNLKVITVDAKNPKYRSVDGILYNFDKSALITYPSNILLSSFTIPNSVTTIYDSAFSGCKNLTSVNIGRVEIIDNSAFEGCSSLENINIPAYVDIIGNNVFKGCINLKSITVDEDNNQYRAEDGILYNKDMTILITCPANILLSSFTIQSSVKTIDNNAFNSCINLTSITIPDSVTFIGNNVFEDCTNLQTINVDLNFNQTLLEGKIPSNTKILISCTGDELRDKLFTYDSSIYTRIINDTTHDGFYADENAGTISIHNVTITNDLLTQLFYPWSERITEVDLSGVDLSRVRIFDGLFQDSHSLEAVDLSNWNITTDETVNLINMFAGSGIKNITLPNLKVKYIDGMFSDCYMLEELDLSNLDVSQATRMDRLFENCSKLKTLNLTGWDTSKVENMSSMFEGCEGFDSLKM